MEKSNDQTANNGVVLGHHKQCKTLRRDHMVRLKIMSLYIYSSGISIKRTPFVPRRSVRFNEVSAL